MRRRAPASGAAPGMMKGYCNLLFSLEGRTAVVIGGTGELCGMMAEGLAAAGAHVVLVGSDATKAESRLEKIRVAGGKASFEPCEVTSRAELADLVKRIQAAAAEAGRRRFLDRTGRPCRVARYSIVSALGLGPRL